MVRESCLDWNWRSGVFALLLSSPENCFLCPQHNETPIFSLGVWPCSSCLRLVHLSHQSTGSGGVSGCPEGNLHHQVHFSAAHPSPGCWLITFWPFYQHGKTMSDTLLLSWAFIIHMVSWQIPRWEIAVVSAGFISVLPCPQGYSL